MGCPARQCSVARQLRNTYRQSDDDLGQTARAIYKENMLSSQLSTYADVLSCSHSDVWTEALSWSLKEGRKGGRGEGRRRGGGEDRVLLSVLSTSLVN